MSIEICVNNLYSCPPNDDIRCDLACQMLHYVPCQTIQDRRACFTVDEYYTKPIFYILAVILFLFVLIGIFILLKYFQQRFNKSLDKVDLY